jgi:hypothetical protein
MQALLLIIATTVLTCSSVFGFYFLHLFSCLVVSQVIHPVGRKRKAFLFLVLSLLSFGLSFGSGKLSGYLLSKA